MKHERTSHDLTRRLLPAASLFLMLATGVADAKTLTVPDQSQKPQTNWCWAASSRAVLSYTSKAPPSMCQIAEWARGKNAWGAADCCGLDGTGALTAGNKAVCNQANAMWGADGSIEAILKNWGADSEKVWRALTLDEVKKDVDDDAPVIVRWGWTAGGGHFVVLRGYTDANLDIMDPWDGAQILTHANVSATAARTWTHSLVVKPKKVTYVVDDTGSMGDDIASVRSVLTAQVDGYAAANRFTKYALITYKDDVTYVGSTLDSAQIKTWIGALGAYGGGDCTEEGYGALDMAAEKAPGSEIWWMTDADSHGGVGRMLSTAFKLSMAGNVLHSTILGACSEEATAAARGSKSILRTRSSTQADSMPYVKSVGGAGSAASAASVKTLAVDPAADVSAWTAGRLLSAQTGGLYFTVTGSTLAGATTAIVEEMGANSLIERVKLASGSHSNSVPVDSSVTAVKFLINIPKDRTGTLAVTGPDGVALATGVDGVTEVAAGDSKMIVVKAPALKVGTYTVASSVDGDYLLSVSAVSDFSADLAGDTTAGVGARLPVAVALSGMNPPTALSSPHPSSGESGSASLPARVYPFDSAKLTFKVVDETGAAVTTLTMADDGLHGDGRPGDGVYGGSFAVPASAAQYRVVVSDGATFKRVTRLLVTSGTVSVDSAGAAAGKPGDVLTQTFTVKNLSASTRTFNLTATSTSGWESVASIPATLTVDAGATGTVTVSATVPGGATAGQTSVLTINAVASDDASVYDSAVYTTTAWSGPLVSALSPSTVDLGVGRTLTITGSGFGVDPGAANRSSAANHVSIGGVQLAAADVTAWADGAITVAVPSTSTGGLLVVTAGGNDSNASDLVVIPASGTPTPTPAPEKSDGGGGAFGAIELLLGLIGLGGLLASRRRR